MVGEAPIWHTAEAKHPGIMNAAALLFDKLGMRVDVRELIAPAIYQNHFLCRPQLLRSYCDGLLAPAIELMEADEELNRALSVNAHYQVQNLDDSEMRKIFGQSSATLHPFVCERLLSTWLSINRCTDKVKQIWDGRFVEPGRQYADSEHRFGLPAKDLRTYGQKDHAYDAAIVVTTHGEEVWYTQRCLQRIAEWKTPRQQVVVVYHDASPLLRSYLEFLAFEGVIDVLLRAEPSHGHVRGVNLGVWHSDAPYVFHIRIDVTVGPGIGDECIRRMEGNPELGAVGWHYQWGSREQGSHWIGDDLVYTVRPQDKDMDCRDGDELSLEYSAAVEQAPWFTGRVFSRIGKKRLLFFNGSFFGVRRALWDVLGGFDESRFSHYWAEDLLCYGILDQGYGIGDLPANLSDGSNPDFFSQTSELKWTGREDPDRNRNELVWASQIGHPGSRSTSWFWWTCSWQSGPMPGWRSRGSPRHPRSTAPRSVADRDVGVSPPLDLTISLSSARRGIVRITAGAITPICSRATGCSYIFRRARQTARWNNTGGSVCGMRTATRWPLSENSDGRHTPYSLYPGG